MKTQFGSINLLPVGALAVLAFALVAYLFINNLVDENKRLTAEVIKVTKERDDSVERENKLKNDIKTEQDLRTAAESVSATHLEEIKRLDAKVADLLRRWPKAIPKDKDVPVSPDQDVRSKQRVEILWEIFCHNNLEHPRCKKGEAK